MKKLKFQVGTSLAMPLWSLLTNQYWNGVSEKYNGEGINFYSYDLFYSPVIAINIWEAILSEAFQNDILKSNDGVFNDASEAIEKWDIKTKTIVYPKLLTGKNAINNTDNLWADFKLICKLRNELIHYKSSLYEGPSNEVERLIDKGITINTGEAVMPWINLIATTEVTRFCINTIAEMIEKLFDVIKETGKMNDVPISHQQGFFKNISEKEVKDFMIENNIPLNREKPW